MSPGSSIRLHEESCPDGVNVNDLETGSRVHADGQVRIHRVGVVVTWYTKHWPSVAILRVANGLNYSDPWGEDRGQMSSTASRQEEKSHPTTSHRCFLQMAFFYNLVSNGEIFPMFVYFNK
uniref:(northern house mosquito) hypothetical protein n=1 Tax=Culex pipiens TaxID=7175 RepID=A0A8D8J3P8_CULPI